METSGLASSQASATAGRRRRPAPSATVSHGLERAPGVRRCPAAARCPSTPRAGRRPAAAGPCRYLPESKPRASGLQTITPRPKVRAAGTSSRSASRSTSDHCSCTDSKRLQLARLGLPERLGQPVAGVVRAAGVADLARADQVVERAQRLLDAARRRPACAPGRGRSGRCAAGAASPRTPARMRRRERPTGRAAPAPRVGKRHLVASTTGRACAAQPLAEQLLGAALAVDVGGVDGSRCRRRARASSTRRASASSEVTPFMKPLSTRRRSWCPGRGRRPSGRSGRACGVPWAKTLIGPLSRRMAPDEAAVNQRCGGGACEPGSSESAPVFQPSRMEPKRSPSVTATPAAAARWVSAAGEAVEQGRRWWRPPPPPARRTRPA